MKSNHSVTHFKTKFTGCILVRLVSCNSIVMSFINVFITLFPQVFKDKVLGYFLRKGRPRRSASDNLVTELVLYHLHVHALGGAEIT